MAKDEKKTKCPSCDASIIGDPKHCPDCGAKMKSNDTDDKGEEVVARGVKRAFKELHDEAKKGGKKSPLSFLFGE